RSRYRSGGPVASTALLGELSLHLGSQPHAAGNNGQSLRSCPRGGTLDTPGADIAHLFISAACVQAEVALVHFEGADEELQVGLKRETDATVHLPGGSRRRRFTTVYCIAWGVRRILQTSGVTTVERDRSQGIHSETYGRQQLARAFARRASVERVLAAVVMSP